MFPPLKKPLRSNLEYDVINLEYTLRRAAGSFYLGAQNNSKQKKSQHEMTGVKGWQVGITREELERSSSHCFTHTGGEKNYHAHVQLESDIDYNIQFNQTQNGRPRPLSKIEVSSLTPSAKCF